MKYLRTVPTVCYFKHIEWIGNNLLQICKQIFYQKKLFFRFRSKHVFFFKQINVKYTFIKSKFVIFHLLYSIDIQYNTMILLPCLSTFFSWKIHYLIISGTYLKIHKTTRCCCWKSGRPDMATDTGSSPMRSWEFYRSL